MLNIKYYIVKLSFQGVDMQLSIKDYASMKSISPQAVYQAINKGRLKTLVKNGKKYIVASAEEIKAVDEAVDQGLDKSIVKDLMKQLKRKDKEIKQLMKQLINCGKSKEEVLVQYIQELKQLQLPSPVEDVFIEADIKQKKKKSKKQKKKSKNK